MAGESPSQEDLGPISTINVTPFVDVVLVLLIIFMVTAPMLVRDLIGIKLPKTSTTDGKKAKTFGVAITREGQILLNGKLVDPEALQTEIKAALAIDLMTQAIISADGDARHADVVRAIDLLKTAGLNRFAVQVEHQSSDGSNGNNNGQPGSP